MRPGSDSGSGRNQGLGRREWRPVLPNAEIGPIGSERPASNPLKRSKGAALDDWPAVSSPPNTWSASAATQVEQDGAS
jgi:hypothetical protein